MLFTFFPAAASAADEMVYKQITAREELTDGSYVMVVDSGYAVGALDGAWLAAAELAATGGSITGPAANLVWDIAVTEDGVTLTDSSGTQVAPNGGNSNGIKAGDYTWAISFENGTFRFLGTGEDTVTLASKRIRKTSSAPIRTPPSTLAIPATSPSTSWRTRAAAG